MVATRGQTGSDGPATSTPSSAASVRHVAETAPSPYAGATGGGMTTQAGGCTKATQADPAARSRLPWLPTDEETETEPEDLYSQGDRVDSRKDRWERAVGAAVSGTRRLVLLRGPLGRDLDCCEEEMNDRSQQSRYGESRPLRRGHPAGRASANATVTHAMYGEADDCCGPENDCYSSRDPWYMQLQTSRPTYDVVWGSQQSRPMMATGVSAAAVWHPKGNDYSKSQLHPVPLGAPDVALRGHGIRGKTKARRGTDQPGVRQGPPNQQIASTPDGTTGSRGIRKQK